MAAMNSAVITFNYSVLASSELIKLSPMLPVAISSPVSTAAVKCTGIRSQQITRVSDSNISIANNDGRRSAILGLAGVLFTVATTSSSANAAIINKEINDKKNFARAGNVQLGTCKNFTGCEEQKALLSLSREGRSVAAFDMRMTVPDQTPEEAVAVVKSDANSLIESVRDLANTGTLEERKETRKTMRKSAAVLKLDLYTIIQGKPGVERPDLRRLYTALFNGVTDLDFAARDNDVAGVRQLSDGVITKLNEVLSRIL